MSSLKSLILESQPSGSGVFGAPAEAAHFVRLQDLENAINPLAAASHAPVTVTGTNSLTLALPSGGQLLSGFVHRKTSLSAFEGLIGESTDGLYVVLGTGANVAARGSDLVALDAAKANVSHTHVVGDVDGLSAALSARSLVGHTHAMTDISGLLDALAGKADASDTWSIEAIDGLQGALDGKADAAHIHEIVDVISLQAALDGKSDTGHTHANATTSDAGFLSAADKQKLDNLSESEFWLAPVASTLDLPLNTDPVGACRAVLSDPPAIYRCKAQVGLLADQWEQIGGSGSVGKFTATICDGVNTEFDVTHLLDTMDVVVSVRESSGTRDQVECDISILDENTIHLAFDEAPSSGGMRCTVLG